MNYLGHIFFSFNHSDFAKANLFGDFFKGGSTEKLPDLIGKGVRYHREIDVYIDNHLSVKQLLPFLRDELPKVSGIAIDLYFDHLLAKNWSEFHSTPLNEYLEKHYKVFNQWDENYPEEFNKYMQLLVERNWISQYQTEDGLFHMCKGVSRRISFENSLGKGFQVFKANEVEINKAFRSFMKEAEIYFSSLFLKYYP